MEDVDSGVQIQENIPEEELLTSQEDGLLLGDRILIQSKRYGQTLGTIYYIDDSLIRILPDGVSDRLYDFPIENASFVPDLGVLEVQTEEGKKTSFVDLIGLRPNINIDAYTAKGDVVGIFLVKDVNSENDSAIIIDKSGSEFTLEFAYRGIPRDAPFEVIHLSPESEDVSDGKEEGVEEEGEEEGEGEFEEVGFFEMPALQRVEEVADKDVTYPEDSQKSDFMNDLLSFLDAPTQRNPIILKRIRSAVELFHTLKIQTTGKLSFNSLADILENRSVPLARPVLNTKRILEIDILFEYEDTGYSTDQLEVHVLDTTVNNIIDYMNRYGNFLSSGNIEDQKVKIIPIWYQYLWGIFSKFPLGDIYRGTDYTFQTDSEYLRQGIIGSKIEGFPKLGFNSKQKVDHLEIGKVPISLRRGLGPTIRKQGDRGTRIVFPADSADIKYFLLFPQKASPYIGTTRTGSLYNDILRSGEIKKGIMQLFSELGEPTDEPDANNILLLRSDDATLANIKLSDYLEAVLKVMSPRGLGDINILMNDLGMANKEYTAEQQDIIQQRINQTVLSLRGFIRSIRAPFEFPAPVSESFSGKEFTEKLIDKIKEHPLLNQLVLDLKQRSPGFATTDLGILGTLVYYAQNYTFAVLGNQLNVIKRERVRMTRDSYIIALLNAQRVRINQAEKGVTPESNPCNHTKALSQIRGVTEDNERMSLLSKFLDKFQGGREDNWITCIVCEKHLICQHELLQIQQFLHPREFDVLQKQIILNFAGGTFGAKHICRNCGLAINDIEFDRGIEFDDEGHPLNGRGVIVDEDAIEEEKIQEMLGGPVGKEEELQFETEEKTQIYRTTREICDIIGVFPELEGYRRIVNRVNVELLRLPNKKAYLDQQAKTKNPIDYDVYINRFLVGLIASCLLIEIQTKIPDYTLRYTVPGCRAGFDGYPLFPSANPKSPVESVGIYYIACAINGITKAEAPWTLTGWQKERSDEKRQETIVDNITKILQGLIVNEAMTQLSLEKKREYRKEILGKESDSGRPSEKIPIDFAPPIETERDAILASAASPVVSDATKDSSAISLNWIRVANTLAKTTAHIIKGSPYSETGSSWTNVKSPGAFWKDHASELPTLPPQKQSPFALSRQTWLFVPFEPKPSVELNVEIPFDLSYKIFARLCYKGPREGYPHELGFDGKCDWCDIQIPPEAFVPDIDDYGKPVTADEFLLKSFTEDQGIAIDRSTFERLLSVSNNRNIFESYRGPSPQDSNTILSKLGTLSPTPIEDWSTIIPEIVEKISRLKSESTRVEIAESIQIITGKFAEIEDIVRRRLGREAFDSLETILSDTSTFFEKVKAHLIIPINRILTNYSNTFEVHKEYNLSKDHMEDIIKILDSHAIIKTNPEKLGEYGRSKYKYYLEQMSAILKMAPELKVSRLPYGSILLPYIMRIFLYGPLSNLVNPNSITTDDSVAQTTVETGRSVQNIQESLTFMIQKISKERLSYSPDVVREMIARASEKEKDSFINSLDALNDDDKKIELMKKRIGIGKWSIGGSKLIWAYNRDQYDKERIDRLSQYNDGYAANDTPQLLDPSGFAVSRDEGSGYSYKLHDEAEEEA